MGIFNEYGLPGLRGPPGIGYKLTPDGNYNMDNKKLTNLKEGTDNNDAISKDQLQTGLASKADKTELNDYIFKSGLSSNLDMKNKIVNLKTATSGNDAVNFT